MKCLVCQYVDMSVRYVLTYSRTYVLSFEPRDSLTPRPIIQLVPLHQLVPVAPAGLALLTGIPTLLSP